MVLRTCPYCHMPNHSADAISDWKCLRCGATIVREYNQSAPNYAVSMTGTMGETKLTSATDWARLTTLISEIITALDNGCTTVKCDFNCPSCSVWAAKENGEQLKTMLEVLG